MERQAEIENRLKAAYPAQWEWVDDCEIARRGEDGSGDTLLCYSRIPTLDMLAQFRSEGDRELVVHAPEDIAWLLDRIRSLEAGLRTYGRHINTAAQRCGFYGDGAEVDCTCGLVDLIDGNPPGTIVRELGGLGGGEAG